MVHPAAATTTESIEEQLIAGILLRPSDYYHAESIVTSQDFFSFSMRAIWDAYKAMAKEGVEFWRESVLLSELRKRGVIDAVGGQVRFAELITKTVPGYVVYHAEEVAKWSERRRVLFAIEDAARKANELAFDADEVTQSLQASLMNAKRESGEEVKQVGRSMAEYLAYLEDAKTSRKESPVVSTGFFSVDKALSGGLPLGEYSILAARPSIGKTALAMDISINAAKAGSPVLFCSLEMTAEQINRRLLVRDGGVSMLELQGLSYSDSASITMLKACGEYCELPLYVWQAAGATVGRIESRIRSEVSRRGVKLVVVDYIGLIKGSDFRQSPYDRVTMISSELARIGKQVGVHMLVLCQLGRAAEGEVPNISQLRDSGAIEQDADIIFLLHREKRDSTEAKLLLEKQRNGAISQMDLAFQGGKRFTDPQTEAFKQAAVFHGDF